MFLYMALILNQDSLYSVNITSHHFLRVPNEFQYIFVVFYSTRDSIVFSYSTNICELDMLGTRKASGDDSTDTRGIRGKMILVRLKYS